MWRDEMKGVPGPEIQDFRPHLTALSDDRLIALARATNQAGFSLAQYNLSLAILAENKRRNTTWKKSVKPQSSGGKASG
jgi:hypothetical protein